MNKSLLVGFVKEDNTAYFLDGGQTKIYYTGKTTINRGAEQALLFHSLRSKARVSRICISSALPALAVKAEIHPESDDKDPRLVFELEYLELAKLHDAEA